MLAILIFSVQTNLSSKSKITTYTEDYYCTHSCKHERYWVTNGQTQELEQAR